MKVLALLTLLFSFSAQAALKDILCTMYLKRIEKTPILMKKDPDIYFKFWLESLDAYFANPNSTPQEIAKTVFPQFGREDLEKMKAVVEDKIANLEKIAPEWNDYIKEQSPKHIGHPGDLTIQDYHTFFKARAAVFLKKIDVVLKAEKHSYFDLLSSANLYSVVADPTEWMGPFVSEFKKLSVEERKAHMEVYLKKLVEESETKYFHAFPMYLKVPSFKNLGFRAMNTMFGIPVYYMGLVDGPLKVDGMHYGIAGFYFHDSTHVPGAFDIFMRRHIRTKWGYVNFASLKTRNEKQIGAMIDNALKLNMLYGEYAERVMDPKKGLTKTEQKLAEGIFFFWSHETPLLELLRVRTDREMKEFFAKFEKDIRKEDFEQTLIRRFNNTDDLGQAFKDDERPITREMISKLIRRVFH